MEHWALVMFAALMALLMLGYPVAFTLGAVALGFGAVFLGWGFFDLLPMRIWGIMTNFTLLAVPLFVFMGLVLEKTGMAARLIESAGMLFGRRRGGLALSIVLIGTLLAASTGVVGATVVAMGVIAMPILLRHRYDPAFAAGVVASSGTLGQIIPPSVILILLGDVIGVAVGELFMAALVPGMLLVGLYLVYILVIAWLRPERAPAIDQDVTGQGVSAFGLMRDMFLPLALVIAVLGSIFFGIASPTESAAIGALGALLLGVASRSLTLRGLMDAMQHTVRLTSMVFLILIGATAFGLVFRGMGGDMLVEQIMTGLPGGVWGFLALSMLLVFVLGFFLDFLEICFIVVPILAPIALLMGIDPLWFAVLIAVNLQTSFLTPPFGFSLFYLKASAPPELRIQQIYRGALPFVGLQFLALGIIMVFPQVALWLPELMNRLQGF
ncbi:MAG: TRAP transporter large permease subunit [Gammaproteobacteria bacterium]|nr:TRAP transporter large permease subunit [Gammaproteobacteria bacterium]